MFSRLQRSWLVLLAAAAFAFGSARLSAADADAESANDAMSFHRVFAPADRIDEWPRGTVRYVPMDRVVFERIVADMAAEAKSPANREARVESAKYTARLEADGTLRGRGELTVHHASTRGVLLNLGACDLSIVDAAWKEAASAAVLGMRADGRLMLLVERSDTLRFDFTLGNDARIGRNVVSAAVPSGMATRWLLDAPGEITPDIEFGLIEPVGDSERTEAAKSSPDAAASEDAGKIRRTWKIELGSVGRLALSLNASRPPREHVVVTRQTTEYKIAPSGLSLATTLTLDVFQTPLERLTLRMDEDTTPLNIRVDNRAARIVANGKDAVGGRLITIELAEPILGVGQTITLDAIAPLRMEGRWRLPRIAPYDMPWREASAQIVVQSPLRIERLWPSDAELSSAVSPNAASVKYVAAEGAVDVFVAWSKRTIQATTVTLLDVGGEARGSTVIDAVFSDRAMTSISGIIEDGWSVESVTSTPLEAIVDWQIERNARGGERIVVECRPDASRRATIAATIRWRGIPEQRPLTPRELRVIDWRESCEVTRSLASIAPAQSYQLETKGAHRLYPLDSADDVARRHLAGHNGQIQFDLDAATSNWAIGARRAATPYRGDIDVDVKCSTTHFRETYRVRCTPLGDGLTRVVVRVSPAAHETIIWTGAVDSAESISARRLSDDESRAFLIEPGSELWLLSLGQPRSEAFEIVGERTRSFHDDTPISLATLHDAAAQSGKLTIRADAAADVGIENLRLTSLPRSDGPIGAFDDLRAMYRYVPTRDVIAADPAVVLTRRAHASVAAIAYSCRLAARIHSGGHVHRRAQFDIDNFGRTELMLDIVESTMHFEVQLDGEIVARGNESDGPVRVPLPEGRRFVTLTVDYSVDADATGWYGATVLQAPQIDVPVLRRQWSVFVPEAYSVFGDVCCVDRRSSWTQRWFGPLARAQGDTTFDPMSWQSWMGRSPRRIEKLAARDATLTFVDKMGESMMSIAGDPASTWSAFVADVADEAFFVDVEGLDGTGVRPWTQLPVTTRSGGRTQVAQLLFDANLAIVTDGERFALTSAAVANALDGAATIDPAALGGLRINARWLTTTKRSDVGLAGGWSQVGTGRIVDAEMWAEAAGAFSLPWRLDAGGETWRGWRRIELVDDGNAVTVRWISLHWVRVATWVGLIGAAAFAWSFSRRRRTIVVSLAVVAVAVLLLDDALLVFSPILSGVWWGMCVGLALAWLPRSSYSKRRTADSRSETSRRRKGVATVGMFIVAVTCAVRSWADGVPTLDSVAKKTAATIHRVFIPVDDEQKPVGERVYVPEPLFARLERWKIDRERGPRGSIVAAAVHRIQLDWNSDGTSLETRAAMTVVDAQTFDDNAVVSLPFAAAGDVRLDGALLDVGNYTIDEGQLRIAVAKAGAHRIEVAALPTATEREGRTGVDATAVGAATTRLEIETPENGPEVEVFAGTGERRLSRGRGAFAVPMAAARTFRVEWTKVPARGAGENIETTERLWLDVAPGIVEFTADVAIRDEGGLPEELRVLVDPRWMPLTATVDGVATTWRRVNGATDQLAFRLKSSEVAEKRLSVKFVARSTPGVGLLRLPRWEPQVREVRRRWLAVNVDESLEREITAGPEAQPMNVDDFVQRDGDEDVPNYAYRLARGSVLWNLSTRRKASEVQIAPTMAAVGESGRVRIAFDGDLAIRSDDIFEHVLRCDERLKVDRIAVVEDGDDCLGYWTQATDGIVQVFLNRRAGTRQQIRVEGHIETPSDGVVAIREITMNGATRSGFRFLLFRMPSVGLAVRELTGLVERTGETTQGDSHTSASGAFVPPVESRLLRDLVVAGDDSPSATIELTRNAPKIDATSVMVVEEVEADAWSVRAEFRGTVKDGLADDLIVDLPGDWIGDAAVEPPMPTTVVDSPDGRRRLMVRPVLPLRGGFRLTVAGQVRTPESRAAPRWKLLDADELREFAVLPTLWQGRRLGWDLAQMRRSALDDGFAMPHREGARYQAYRVAGERATATLQAEIPFARSLEAYVDVVAADIGDGTRALLTTFDLLPSGVASCRVSMPDGARFVSAVLENRIASSVRDNDDVWEIDLESDSLPQRLQILTIADAGESTEAQRVWAAPRLEDAAIRRTTWAVAAADALPPKDESIDAIDATVETRMAARVDALEKLWLAAARSSSEYQTLVASRWERRLAAASTDHRLAKGGANEAPSTASSSGGGELNPSDRWNYVVAGHREGAGGQVATLVQQFGATPWGPLADDVVFQLPAAQAKRFADELVRDGATARATVVATPPKVVERSEVFRRVLAGRRFHCRTEDEAAWTWSAPTAASASAPVGRWTIAVGVLAFASFLFRQSGRSYVCERVGRHPHLALAVAGVVWWLWLWPGWIGWVLIAASILWSWRLTWPLPTLVGRARPSSFS